MCIYGYATNVHVHVYNPIGIMEGYVWGQSKDGIVNDNAIKATIFKLKPKGFFLSETQHITNEWKNVMQVH